MKRLAILLALVLTLPLSSFGQTARRIIYSATLPAVCNPNAGDVFFLTVAPVGIHACTAANTWTFSSGGITGSTGADNRVAVFTTASNIEGDADFRFDTTANTLVVSNGSLSVGTNPAAVGSLRIGNNELITARNVANTADVTLISLSSSDVVNVGFNAVTTMSAGTGTVQLGNATGEIRFNKPLVALGGGAAPTLGTIGGSGPVTATQNSWLRLFDSTGAVIWVPVWK